MDRNGHTQNQSTPFKMLKLFILSIAVMMVSSSIFTTHAANWTVYFDSLIRFSSGFTKSVNYKRLLNLKNRPEDAFLMVQHVEFGNLDSPINTLSASSIKTTVSDQNLAENNTPRVVRKPLVFPNPFRQEDGGIINYELSADMDMSIHIYDMAGNKIFERDMQAGGIGAKQGNNVQILDNSTFDGYNLSAGVYFIYLISDEAVLSKGKLAVVP